MLGNVRDPADQILQTFKYRKNQILNKLLQGERDKEASVVLQVFRFLIETKTVWLDQPLIN